MKLKVDCSELQGTMNLNFTAAELTERNQVTEMEMQRRISGMEVMPSFS